ncbi:MAG: hypothetical protein ACK521_02560 [bacterium]
MINLLSSKFKVTLTEQQQETLLSAYQQPTASESKRVKLTMFDITGQYKATEDAYKSLKHQMNKNEVVDASGLFGPRHRMKEIHRGKQQKISEFE